MTVTVTDDHTNIWNADSATGQNADGSIVGGSGQTNTTIFVQGTASNIYQAKGIGVGSGGVDLTNIDISYTHLYGYFRSLDFMNTAPSGARFRMIDGTDFTTNFGEWDLGGQDTLRVSVEGFTAVCVNTARGWDRTTGTAPPRTAVDGFGIGGDFISTSGQNTFFVDQFKEGGVLTITAGSPSAKGQSSEIATADDADGRGTFKFANGAYFLLTGLVFGNTSGSSYFQDIGETWFFEDFPVSASLYVVDFVGSASLTNEANFGTSTGSGVDEEGSGGNVFTDAGEAPSTWHALDSNIDAGFFGCRFNGPSASQADTVMRAFQDNNGTFTDVTVAANQGNSFNPFPTSPDTNDNFYVGHHLPFSEVDIVVSTAGAGTYTVVWEYYNGTSWTALTDVTDTTTNFKVATNRYPISFSRPDDWVKTTVNSVSMFWIRANRDGGTETTRPALDSVTIAMQGDVRLEQANAKAIRSVFNRKGSIRIRNGAFLKKSTITDSIVHSKHAALDLGGSDPTADTVRDLLIQNCPKGILLKGSGNTTYNFRAIELAGNNTIENARQLDSPSTFTDMTTESNDTTANDIEFFPATPVSGDAFYLADSAPFNEISMNIGQAGAGTYTNAVQYWNGTTWTAVSGLTDGTDNFKNSGTNTVTFTRPTDWNTTTVNSIVTFWMRFLRDGGTQTTRPLGTQIEIPGDVRVDFGSGDTVTLNILEGGSAPQIDNVNGSTVNIVNDPATTKFTIEDVDGNPVENARVLAETADSGGPSGFPFEDTVTTLTQSAGTATLTASAAHGLSTGDSVTVRGAQPDGYNKAAQITVTSTTVFTYNVPSGLSSPATGTPVFSYAPIGGVLTNASGVVSSTKAWNSSQGLKGYARKKNTVSPFYQDGDINITDASVGTDQIITLQPDE